MKETILKQAEALKSQLADISDYIYQNPELGDKEFKSSEKLASFLKDNGFKIEMGIVKRKTAFRAIYDSGKSGPSIAYLCEYDALPEIGHGCGHNMIGTMSAGAAVVLSKISDKIGGRIVALGTPAEETNGAKVDMAADGIFNDIDAAMILHPSNATHESGRSLAMDALQFSFKGKASHAASSPEAGINALDAVILTFNGINALRQHVTPDVRIHGIITEGGVAANVVPDKAAAKFYIRAGKKNYLSELTERVKNIARGASMMTGAELEIINYEISYEDLNTNKALSNAFSKNLRLIGINDIEPPRSSFGSIDIGNVSNVVPAIHPYISIGCSCAAHTKEMADHTITEEAHEALMKGAAALALTGYDVITDKELMNSIKEEFKKSQK